MKYPTFLNKNDTIGICAPSAGVGKKLESFDKAIHRLSKDFKVIETESVRINNVRSNSAKIRAEEFLSLIEREEVKAILCASGGDFLFEILPYVDFEKIIKQPKWIMGYSDPTSLLYTITTKYDIATFYGCNAGTFDNEHAYIDTNLHYLKGNLLPQNAYKNYQYTKDWLEDINEYNGKVEWIYSKDIDCKGRCIGGCIDVLNNIFATEYDGTKQFIEKYKEDGIIWYFDNFAMSSENFYLTLLQMKYAGYFKYTKAVIVGRTLFESESTSMTYKEALERALEDIPFILNADIGHVSPKMTMINGAILHLYANKNKQCINFELA